MTYAEILEDGKQWKAEQEKVEAEQKVLAEKVIKKKQEEKLLGMQQLTITSSKIKIKL